MELIFWSSAGIWERTWWPIHHGQYNVTRKVCYLVWLTSGWGRRSRLAPQEPDHSSTDFVLFWSVVLEWAFFPPSFFPLLKSDISSFWHLGSLTAANWVSFDFNVSYSSCWGHSLINTLKLKKKIEIVQLYIPFFQFFEIGHSNFLLFPHFFF